MPLHPYHIVTVSPWPFTAGIALFDLALGLRGLLHETQSGGVSLTISLSALILVIALWCRDVVTEGVYLRDHTTDVQRRLGLRILLFVVSELMVFVSIFWAYFHSALSPNIELGISWPPMGIEGIDPMGLPLCNTVLLLSSRAACTWAHHAVIRGARSWAQTGLATTIAIAVIFTACQGLEFLGAPFDITDRVFGSTFYIATRTHGFHVVLRTLFIAVGIIRLTAYQSTSNHHVGLQFAIIYWHFVDVIWLLLFVAVYGFGA